MIESNAVHRELMRGYQRMKRAELLAKYQLLLSREEEVKDELEKRKELNKPLHTVLRKMVLAQDSQRDTRRSLLFDLFDRMREWDFGPNGELGIEDIRQGTDIWTVFDDARFRTVLYTCTNDDHLITRMTKQVYDEME